MQEDADHAAGADRFGLLVLAFLLAALACGGSSSNAVSAAIVRVTAVPILAIGLWRLAPVGANRAPAPGALWPLLILAFAAAVVAAQCIPLPPDLWRALPGHARFAGVYPAAGMATPWLPISMTPAESRDALLGLIPPAAMLAAVPTLAMNQRRVLAGAVLAAALVSVGLGILQVAGGPESPLRPYAITNPNSAVGLFANRNHQASFLAASLPLAGYLAARWGGHERGRSAFWASVGLGFGLVIAAGAATTGSRAGVVLAALGAVAAMIVALRARVRRPGPLWRLFGLAGPALAVAAVLGVIVLVFDAPLAAAAQAQLGGDLRFSLTPITARAGAAFAPFGSGAGSFAAVYATIEPLTTLGPAFVNHAHDDLIEVWLETGVFGVALMAAFLVWWARAALAASTVSDRRGAALALAGSAMLGLLALHSLVDYPLRTPALAVLFALACGFLTEAPARR